MIVRKKKKPLPAEPPRVARMVEDIVGCKWSLCVLDLVNRGIVRPGAMQRAIHGLTTKVLNERLRKLARFGILSRQVYAEVPPRVEYHLTPFGQRFTRLLEDIEALQSALDKSP
ncbi:MAG: helix-turn-helix transcriptional regulator [Gammaproteobacteria bacterium]|nr:helix-turn-helix transcriptional regulator [Gammaproteobacteria bacterium]